MLRNVRVIEHAENGSNTVRLGARIKLKDLESNEIVEYTLVGSAEADPTKNKISNESPVGKAIINKKKGAVVEVSVPAGTSKYKILDII